MTWEITYPDRPVSMNQYIRMSYWQIAEVRSQWRKAFMVCARNARIPHLGACEISAWCILPNKAHWQDIGNCYPSVKWAIDGLVDAGVIRDDSQLYVRKITLLPTEIRAKTVGLVLRVDPVASVATGGPLPMERPVARSPRSSPSTGSRTSRPAPRRR